jgi:hypothetical protein
MRLRPKPALPLRPHSWIADVELPEGTVPCTAWECEDSPYKYDNPHGEYWRYSAPYDDTVAFLRDQFAAGLRYDAHGATWWKGLPPCYDDKHQSPPWGWTSHFDNRATWWLWSDGAIYLQVLVYQPGANVNKAPFGVMYIVEGSHFEGPPRGPDCYRA